VPLEEGAVGEAFGAEAALEALGTVGAHVDVEGALLGEAFAADAALEGADARVGHHVLQQVVTEREGAPADGTLMGLLACGETDGSLWSTTDQLWVNVEHHGSVWVNVRHHGSVTGQRGAAQVNVIDMELYRLTAGHCGPTQVNVINMELCRLTAGCGGPTQVNVSHVGQHGSKESSDVSMDPQRWRVSDQHASKQTSAGQHRSTCIITRLCGSTQSKSAHVNID